MNDGFNFLDLLILGGIAVFLILRLRASLGRRDGAEGNHHDPFRDKDGEWSRDSGKDTDNVFKFPGQEPGKPDEPVAADEAGRAPEAPPVETNPALAEIFARDPSLDRNGFLNGAKSAFEMVLQAYSVGDQNTLKFLLNDDVYNQFSAAIEAREANNQTMDFTMIGFKSAEITDASLEGSQASITVKFITDQVTAIRDSEDRIIDGDPSAVTTNIDIWTFSRDLGSRNPNWLLVSTDTE